MLEAPRAAPVRHAIPIGIEINAWRPESDVAFFLSARTARHCYPSPMPPLRLASLLLATAVASGQVSPQTSAPVQVEPTSAAHSVSSPKPSDLRSAVTAITQEPGVSRAHWGIAVSTLNGMPLLGIGETQYFMPASNAKLFTTAAAMALLPMQERLATRVVANGNFEGNGVYVGDLLLRGVGDANLSGRPIPYRPPIPNLPEEERDELRFIHELADGIKQKGISEVRGNILGDDSLFPWNPYPSDWAIDDTPWDYGAPISGLTIADNALTLTVSPGQHHAAPDSAARPTATLSPALPYYTVDMQATTGPAGSETDLDVQRGIGSKTLHIYGHIAAGSNPWIASISIDDPAEYAAAALKSALEERGISVTGDARAKHSEQHELAFRKTSTEPLTSLVPSPARAHLLQAAGQAACSDCGPSWNSRILAEHLGPPLYEDIVVTNKISENQHAELFLRQLGFFLTGSATTAQGARVVRSFLTTKVGIDPGDFFFFDGSGLSGHDLVTPRATVKLLAYATTQPWFQRWKASLPVGGVDGSLFHRFSEAPLKGHVFAKTGTLGEARALSGYLDCASGQTVLFSIMVSTHTPRSNEDLKAMDRIVAAIAAAN